MQSIKLTTEENLSRLIFYREDKKLNILDDLCMQDLASVLCQLEENTPKTLIIQSNIPHCFIAGADIDVIAQQQDHATAKALAERGQYLIRRLENLACTRIAVVQGACLGGGLELALACQFIIAVEDEHTHMALPEIQLGIHPGFGGCIRLPKRVGWPQAIEMIVSGRKINAHKAKKIGLATLCCDPLDIAQAEHYLMQKPPQARRKTPFWFHIWPLRQFFFKQVKKRMLQKTKHLNEHAYPALPRTIALLQEIYGMSDGLAFAREAESLATLAVTPSCHHLIRVFKLGQTLKQRRSTEAQHTANNIQTLAIYGAGIMGAGIAWLAAKKHQVALHELHAETLSKGLVQLDTWAVRDPKRLQQIRPSLDDSGLHQVQMIIEAIPEQMAIKQRFWQQLEEKVPADCLLLSNTSSLSITKMQACLKRPERMAGLHFFNPVHKMPLVEVIAGQHTHPHTIESLCALMVTWGKYPIVVQDCPGFLVNRCLLPYLKAAIDLLAQGQHIAHIDRSLKHFGMPMGAFELMDRIGLDICLHVGTELQHRFPEWFEAMVKKGTLGCKRQAGFFSYHDQQQQGVNPNFQQHKPEHTTEAWSFQRITDACLLPMLLEAWHCLDEQVVESQHHLDAAMIYGIGFPAFHGGLLHYFQQQHQGELLQRMADLGLAIEKYKDKTHKP